MNINKININQSESSYYIASDIYDVSARNNDTTFESLSALLGSDNLSTLIPSEIRCGGMTIRFIQSSDNNYVQYRCKTQSFSANPYDWEGEELKIKTTNEDFSVSDDNYDIVRFENGHIRTKNFYSGDAASKNDVHINKEDFADADFAFSDENHNDIVRFENGHIRTKNFYSATDCPIKEEINRDGVSFEDENGNAVFDVHGGYPYTANFDGKHVSDFISDSEKIALRAKKGIPIELSLIYTDEWLEDRVNNINTNNSIVNGVTFAFITDLHFYANTMQSKYLLKYILDKTSVPYAISGGDYAPAYGNEEDLDITVKTYLDYVNYIGKDRFATVRGNHDLTIRYSSSDTDGITKPYGVTYNTLGRPIEAANVELYAENMVWCITNKVQKTKIFGVNSCDTQTDGAWAVNYHISKEQMKWVVNRIEDEYNYIFISHIPTSENLTDSHGVNSQKPLRDLMLAMKNKTVYDYIDGGKDFSSFTGECICHICGHEHHDGYDNTDGIHEILTTCDSNGGTAFDVFTFDFDNRTIKTLRVGRGENRVFTY